MRNQHAEESAQAAPKWLPEGRPWWIWEKNGDLSFKKTGAPEKIEQSLAKVTCFFCYKPWACTFRSFRLPKKGLKSMEGIGPFWGGAYLNITTAVLKHDESAFFFFFRTRDLKPYADCQQHNMGTCSKKPWDFAWKHADSFRFPHPKIEFFHHFQGVNA